MKWKKKKIENGKIKKRMSDKLKYAAALEKECFEKMALVNMLKKNSTNPNITHQKKLVAQAEVETKIAKHAAFPYDFSDYNTDEFSSFSSNPQIYIASQNIN